MLCLVKMNKNTRENAILEKQACFQKGLKFLFSKRNTCNESVFETSFSKPIEYIYINNKHAVKYIYNTYLMSNSYDSCILHS